VATLMYESRSVSSELPDTLCQAGIELTTESGISRDALHAAIARYEGFCRWSVDYTGWVVTLYFPEQRTFSGGTLEDGLTRCLIWLAQRSRGPRAEGPRALIWHDDGPTAALPELAPGYFARSGCP
jgi:hypothetical protein